MMVGVRNAATQVIGRIGRLELVLLVVLVVLGRWVAAGLVPLRLQCAGIRI